MTKNEKDEILCYIAQNFVSTVYHKGVKQQKTAKEIYLEWSGKKFNELCEFVSQFVTEEQK